MQTMHVKFSRASAGPGVNVNVHQEEVDESPDCKQS